MFFCNFTTTYYADFIHKTLLNYKEYNLDQKKIIYEALPLKIVVKIKKRIDSIIEYFNTLDLLSYIPELMGEVKLIFNFNKENLIFLIRLIFGDNLMTIFENQFTLAKYGNVSVDYIDNCTPGEYTIFIGFLQKMLKPKTEEI